MREFLHGWRRKFGIVTLLTACAFMVGWMRSFSKNDVPIESCHGIVASVSGGIIWDKAITDDEEILNWKSSPAFFAAVFEHYSEQRTDKWKWQSFGFGVGEYDCGFVSKAGKLTKYRRSFLRIPYWSITIPITLISAFLILSKPRKSTPKTMAVPPQGG